MVELKFPAYFPEDLIADPAVSRLIITIIIIIIIISHLWQALGLVVAWGSISGRVIPKTQKIVLDTSLFNTQHNKVRFNSKVDQ